MVEAPKGSLVKLKYEIKLAAFTVAHSLPLGLSYPFDWGFVPSTQAPDGDPLDILILHPFSLGAHVANVFFPGRLDFRRYALSVLQRRGMEIVPARLLEVVDDIGAERQLSV